MTRLIHFTMRQFIRRRTERKAFSSGCSLLFWQRRELMSSEKEMSEEDCIPLLFEW